MLTMSDVKSAEDKSVYDMSKQDCLTEIGRILGYNALSRERLSKRMMNSTVWYLTGTEEVYRGWLGTRKSPPEQELRKAVAQAVGFPFPAGGHQSPTSPFRRNQLRAVVISLRDSGDNRWDNE